VVTPDASRSVLTRNDSPDIPFTWSLNPYRGCEHGCVYCYARPGHEYLSLSCGLDFETKIFAKHQAPELLRVALAKKSWTGEPITMSGVTDPYQPIERELMITRRCLEVMLEHRQCVTIITKSRLVTRDLDLLSAMAAYRGARVAVSITSLDPALARVLEPRAASPRERLETVRKLSLAGVPVSVMTAPIIPAINDHELPSLLKAAAEAGATHAGYVVLRLPYQIKDLFADWLAANFPDRRAKVLGLIRSVRDGALYTPEFGTRMRGTGAYAEQLARTFTVFARRAGLNRGVMPPMNTAAFTRPATGRGVTDSPGQMTLF
jgi:DNA repair photolyase